MAPARPRADQTVTESREEYLARRLAETEALLAQDRERLAITFDHAPVGMVRTDLEGRLLEVNQRICHYLGYAPEELLGSNAADYSHPEDVAKDRELFGELLAGRTTRYALIKRYLRKDGSVLWGDLTVSLVRDHRGIPVAAFGVVVDLTQRVEAEEDLLKQKIFLQSIVQSMVEALVITDTERRMVMVNPAFTTLTGYKPFEVLGRTTEMLYADRRDYLAQGRLRYHQSAPVRLEPFEMRYRKKSGEVFTCETVGSLMRDETGKVVGYMGIWRDITQRKEAEARMQRALADKELLLREIHHRVKNNMQVVSSLLGLQSQRSQDPALGHLLGECQRRIRAMALIHETMYRADTFSDIPLQAYLTELANTLRQAHRGQVGDLQVTVEAEGVSLVLDEAVPCGLVMNELISNALKHAFPGGRSGRVEVRARDLPGGVVELVVADDGVGLGEEDWTAGQGTIGLGLVRGLVEQQLHGRLDLDRRRGTRYTISFNRRHLP